PEPVKEPEPKVNSMLFAPYLPSVKEGTAPNKWQKQGAYSCASGLSHSFAGRGTGQAIDRQCIQWHPARIDSP
ncbi:MAG: hypothetical protein ACK422_07695, partial [Burkholderiales bacterium]